MKTFCINLKQSTVRKSHIIEVFEDVPVSKPSFIKAIDFEKNNITPAESCFTSHQLAWQRTSKEKKPVLIIEDDVILHKGFYTHAMTAFNEAIDLKLDLAFFGFQLQNSPTFTSVSTKLRVAEVEPVLFNGAYGYLLSPEGAKKLLQLSKNGVNQFPDLWIAEVINTDAVNAAFLKFPLITHGSFPSTLKHNG